MILKEKQVYVLGALCLVIASFFSTGYHHFDEHFQILEFAGLKLGLTTGSNLPWEYHHQMRSALQPAMVVIVHQLFSNLEVENPFFIATILRLLSGCLAFLSAWMLYQVYKKQLADAVLLKWYLILSFTLWFAVYNGVRFSSENWSGALFIIGFAYFFKSQKRTFTPFLIIGVLFGLSFLCRFQAAFLIFGFASWLVFIKRERFAHLTFMALGFIAMLAIGVCIDNWFYGAWTFTPLQYFEQNILSDKVSGFGVEPWWWYITTTVLRAIPPFSLFIIGAVLVTVLLKPKSPVVWCIVPFILVHCIIGHKELRFLFPIIGFIPISIIHGIEVVRGKYLPKITSSVPMKVFMKLFFVVNAAVLVAVLFKPADTHIALYKKVYQEYSEPTTLYFTGGNPYLRVLDVRFYKPDNLTVEPIDTIDDIPKGKNSMVVLEKRDTTANPRLGKLVYSTYPDWVLAFNFNNWQDRTRAWYVYKVE